MSWTICLTTSAASTESQGPMGWSPCPSVLGKVCVCGVHACVHVLHACRQWVVYGTPTYTGINIFLDGFVPTENLRFRDVALTFKVSETADREEVKRMRSYQYPEMAKDLGGYTTAIMIGFYSKPVAGVGVCGRMCCLSEVVFKGRCLTEFHGCRIDHLSSEP